MVFYVRSRFPYPCPNMIVAKKSPRKSDQSSRRLDLPAIDLHVSSRIIVAQAWGGLQPSGFKTFPRATWTSK